MRWICGFLLGLLAAAGCGTTPQEPVVAAAATPVATPHHEHAEGEPGHAVDPAPDPLLPPDMPDREQDPVGFWTWRVDLMFKNYDADTNGKISRNEFSGDATEFATMDTDGDGSLSRSEVLDRVIQRFALPELVGESPGQ